MRKMARMNGARVDSSSWVDPRNSCAECRVMSGGVPEVSGSHIGLGFRAFEGSVHDSSGSAMRRRVHLVEAVQPQLHHAVNPGGLLA